MDMDMETGADLIAVGIFHTVFTDNCHSSRTNVQHLTWSHKSNVSTLL